MGGYFFISVPPAYQAIQSQCFVTTGLIGSQCIVNDNGIPMSAKGIKLSGFS
jgi:hypothetical protein